MQHRLGSAGRLASLGVSLAPLGVSLAPLGVLLSSAGVLLGASALVGCSGRDISRLDVATAPLGEAGKLELALTARGASGALYRLRQANFNVFPTGPTGSFAFLSSESDPLATSLESTLDIGDYVISLGFGWFLEKVEGGQVTRVQARLLSPESQEFRINANEETSVQYRFETDGSVVEFGQGRLIVEITVDEVGPGGPDGGVPGRLGDPLPIVDGFISPDSNPHGISASLFGITAPIGATLEVTRNTGEMCARGSIDPVLNEDFGTQWGALLMLEFVDAAAMLAQPFALDGGNVTGFAFTITGPDLPFMRLQALPGGADPTTVNFCRGFSAGSGDSFEFPLDSLDRNCWEGIRDPLLTMSLSNIAWLVVSDIGIGHTYDFCVSELRPILR